MLKFHFLKECKKICSLVILFWGKKMKKNFGEREYKFF